jgi:hypothetical protein
MLAAMNLVAETKARKAPFISVDDIFGRLSRLSDALQSLFDQIYQVKRRKRNSDGRIRSKAQH